MAYLADLPLPLFLQLYCFIGLRRSNKDRVLVVVGFGDSLLKNIVSRINCRMGYRIILA
jgi:hypothetical protein